MCIRDRHNNCATDERRDTWLRAQGFKVMRFWNNEIMWNLTGVLETIMAAVSELSVQAASPSPPPLSRKGRGEPLRKQRSSSTCDST